MLKELTEGELTEGYENRNEEAEEFMETFGGNNDGKISYNDYYKWMKEQLD